jgi:hypothetical protein
MICRPVNAGGIVAIACGPTPRRICDICDKTAQGQPEHTRDHRLFDICRRCRARVEMIRLLAKKGMCPPTEKEWAVWAYERVVAALENRR